MKKILVLSFSILFFSSCGTKHKKNIHTAASTNYISVVENIDGSNSAYTEDGHTLIYKTDSNSNIIVYYAKFDDNAGKKGYDRVREKAIRVEIDSSLNIIKNFVSAYGGALCKINRNGIYTLHYFDEQMNVKNIELPELHLDKQATDKRSIESKVKRVIEILTTTYKIAYFINENNKGGWNYIVSALEPTQSIINYNIITQETAYAPNVRRHISKLNSTTEGLTQLHLLFRKEGVIE